MITRKRPPAAEEEDRERLMTEAELQQQIIADCHSRGLWALHVPDSRRLPAGWVDLIILGRRGSLFVELKSTDGRRSLDQIRVARQLEQAGLTYRLWRPHDYCTGKILAELDLIM